MRNVSPPLVPAFDVTVYLVLDDFGQLGRAYVETSEDDADKEPVVRHLIEGQYNNLQRVVAFNTAEGWARDVSEDIAREVRNRTEARGEGLPLGARDFLERHLGSNLPVWMR